MHTDESRYYTCPACNPFGSRLLRRLASDARLLLGSTGLKIWKTTVRKHSHFSKSTLACKDSHRGWSVGSKDSAKNCPALKRASSQNCAPRGSCRRARSHWLGRWIGSHRDPIGRLLSHPRCSLRSCQSLRSCRGLWSRRGLCRLLPSQFSRHP